MVDYDKSGKAVDAFSVKWSEASVNDYSFKQNPGADNSLGQIKFIFYNPYAIYLHDTPAKAAFSQTNRAVSHGCIRVRSEEHTSELQSRENIVCRLLLE